MTDMTKQKINKINLEPKIERQIIGVQAQSATSQQQNNQEQSKFLFYSTEVALFAKSIPKLENPLAIDTSLRTPTEPPEATEQQLTAVKLPKGTWINIDAIHAAAITTNLMSVSGAISFPIVFFKKALMCSANSYLSFWI